MSVNSFVNGTTKQIWFCIISLILFGTVGVCNTYRAFLFYQLDLPNSKIMLSNDEKTSIVSALGLLSPLGSLLAGALMDWLGRKSNMMLMAIPFLISWLLISFATSYAILLVAVLVQSFAMGMCLCLITYTTEICSTKYRGIMLSSVVVAFNVGATICNVLMYFFSWNVVSVIFSGFSVFSAFLVLLLPESPVWLYSKGRTQKVIDILHSIRSATSEEIINEAEEIRDSFAEKKEQVGCTRIMKNCVKAWRQMVTLMGFTLVIMHAGHYIVLSYTVMVVDGLKIPFDEATVSLCYSIVGIGASFFSPFFFYNYNRKPTLAISTFGMGLGMTIVAVYEEMYLYEKEKPAAWIVPLSLFLYVACSNVAILPLGFIIGGEILPAEGRGVLFGIGSGFTSIYYTLTLKFYPQVLFSFGIKALIWCFAVNSFIVTLFAVFVLPETRGKTLNEVQEQYFKRENMEKRNVPSVQTPTKLEE